MLPLISSTILSMWIVPALLYSNVKVIFAMQPLHLCGEKFIFSITAQYVIHMLKLQCHYASLVQFKRVDCSGIALFES